MSISNLPLATLKAAIRLKEQIADLEGRLEKLLGVSVFSSAPSPKKRGRKKMSASARAKIGAAMKARWAKKKGKSAAPAKKKRKSGLSAEGRARIIAAQKKRWAAAKKK